MRLFIEPLDVLFFRDGKPFMAGETHLAESLFPPTALTFQGAIRTAILMASGIDIMDYVNAQRGAGSPEARVLLEEIGDANSFGRLQLTGPFLATLSETSADLTPMPWYVCPLDVVTARKGNQGPQTRLLPIEDAVWSSDLPAGLWPLWARTSARVEATRGFVSQHELSRYLAGEVPTVEPVSKFVTDEPRYGIALQEGRKITKEGMLYGIAMRRLRATPAQRVGFVVDVTGTERLPPWGLLALGGERRAATYEAVRAMPFPEDVTLIAAISQTRRFLLYLATPAVFTQEPQWLPDFIAPEALTGQYDDVTLRVLSIATGRLQPLGGWDLIQNHPRPMRPAVPAGSVYWCELVNGSGEAVMQAFHGQRISSEFAEIGFGLTFVGRWPHV